MHPTKQNSLVRTKIFFGHIINIELELTKSHLGFIEK